MDLVMEPRQLIGLGLCVCRLRERRTCACPPGRSMACRARPESSRWNCWRPAAGTYRTWASPWQTWRRLFGAPQSRRHLAELRGLLDQVLAGEFGFVLSKPTHGPSGAGSSPDHRGRRRARRGRRGKRGSVLGARFESVGPETMCRSRSDPERDIFIQNEVEGRFEMLKGSLTPFSTKLETKHDRRLV